MAGSNRREQVWRVCDELAAQGVKPTMRLVKNRDIGGSTGDVQADVDDWYANVFAVHGRRVALPGIPPEVISHWQHAWDACYARAKEEFDSERQELQGVIDQAKARIEALENQSQKDRDLTAQISNQLAEAHGELDQLRHQLREAERQADRQEALTNDLRKSLGELEQRHTAAAARHAQELQAERERALTLTREQIAEKESECERRIASVVAGHERVEAALTSQINTMTVAQRAEIERADQHYRELERKALREVDEARQALKSVEADVSAARERRVELELQLSALKTELRATKEAGAREVQGLLEQVARLNEQVDRLTEHLSQAKIEDEPKGT